MISIQGLPITQILEHLLPLGTRGLPCKLWAVIAIGCERVVQLAMSLLAG